MKQTKLEALKTCRKLWQVEAEHGTGDSKKYAMEIVQLCEEAIEKENQNKAETERKSKRGEYVLTNLNK